MKQRLDYAMMNTDISTVNNKLRRIDLYGLKMGRLMIKRKYELFVAHFNSKKTGIAVGIIFFITLLPIIYLGLHNYASGDDYWYGIHTYRGLKEAGLIGALKGSFLTVAEFYETWQGTWFTIFLFTLSPHHFHEKGYVITVFLSLGLLIGSFTCLAHFYLVKKLNFSRGTVATIECMVLYLAIQYIPRTTSGIFWFNGIMHYSVPFLLAVMAVIYSHKFVSSKSKKDYAVLFICFTLLGGGSYLVPIASSLAVCLILLSQIGVREINWREKRFSFTYDWSNLWILAAFLAELTGLLISFLAPGNKVRGGEEFGADLKWGLRCIYYAIDRGIYLGEDYFLKNAVTTVIYLMLAVLIWNQMWRCTGKKIKFRLPLLFVICTNGIYWACYVPEIYARSDVSGGVPNTYFHIFLIITLANIIYVHGWIQQQLIRYWEKKAANAGMTYDEVRKKSIWSQEKYRTYFMFPVMALGLIVLLIAVRFSNLATTNDYCVEYVTSGKMAQYVEVRKEQYKILSDPSVEDAVVPEVRESQYPLLHMPLGNKGENFNIDQALYYNKHSLDSYRVD